MTENALFRREGDVYLPGENAGGPWSPDFLHGGAPAGLLATVLEPAGTDGGLRLARFTVDLLRPVPAAPLTVEVQRVRDGRRLRLLQADLKADGVIVSRASALYLEQVPLEVPPAARFPAGDLPPRGDDEASLSEAAGRARGQAPLPLPGLHHTVRVVRVDGVDGSGRGRVWMRLPVPVVAGEACSPSVHAAALADFGNGVGQLQVNPGTGCINTDISLYLHREPRGEWLGMDALARMQPNGNGLVESTLYDRDGPVGRVLQATLAMPVYATKDSGE
ncbi:MAG: thioesterase family protein [Alcanivorax sp.]